MPRSARAVPRRRVPPPEPALARPFRATVRWQWASGRTEASAAFPSRGAGAALPRSRDQGYKGDTLSASVHPAACSPSERAAV